MVTICKNNRGYNIVRLHHEGKTKHCLLHRLVAEAFVINADNKPQVNHIDGNIDNNFASNLEWVTDDENKMHSSIASGGTQRPKKPVMAKELSTNIIKFFNGLREAERVLGLDHKCALNVLKGKQKQTNGYAIRYCEGGDA